MATTDGGAGQPSGALPEAFGRYRILRELGRGGMGVVYQARHTVMNRQVVIKVISKALLDHPDALGRFRREVQAAAQLSHPKIVAAYDAEQAGDTHFLVMEFVPGRSLAEVLQLKGPLPVAHACHYARQVALGLQHAHERGMVHRDIKPANLMLTPKGQVKILDFGLAKVASEHGAGKGLTSSGAYMGTPDYSAPEQATDARKADIRADLYSLGCTLYCLLAGHPPFQEDTAVLTILAHLEKAPLPLPDLRAEVPAGLWAVVARLLAKDPARRYQTPAEVAQALAPFCRRGGKAIPAPPGTPKPPGAVPPTTATLSAGAARGARGQAAPARPSPVPAPAVPSRDQTAAASAQGNVWAGLGAAVGRRQGGRQWGVLAGALGCLGLLVLGGLGIGGLAALSLRTAGADSRRTPLPQFGAGADTAAAPGGARPPSLDCTGPGGLTVREVRQAQEAWARYLGRPVEETIEVADGVKMTFVLIPPGKFRMGSPADEEGRREDETLHEVTLTEPFDLGTTEVTQAQYRALAGDNPSHFRGADLPVEEVSWEEARDYAARLTKRRGGHQVYRLPTEGEWEYACRGGRPSSHPFGVGTGRALSSREANFHGDWPYGDAGAGPNLASTCRVGSYPANALGLFDMHGNVWEWCADWGSPYPAGSATNPTGPADGSGQVYRGGSWLSLGSVCRAADRDWSAPGYRRANLGFRLARSIASGAK
jgi:formylglycine-generating enzyme required for sulfatase activity